MSFYLIWARVALVCYLLALVVALVAARRRGSSGLTRAAVATGFLFQFVGLVEALAAFPAQPIDLYQVITALLAFVVAAFFLMVYRTHSPRALSLLVLPLIVVLAAVAGLAPMGARSGPSPLARSLLHNGWIYVHILLIMVGYAGLVVAMAAGVLYLAAERSLKAKSAPLAAEHWMPPLEKLDLLAYRALLVGFPLLTGGLVIGAYWADALFGRVSLGDPTVMLALLAWAIYLVLLFARWSSGWRGRRSAYLTLVCFAVALAGWLVNGLSRVHSIFLQ